MRHHHRHHGRHERGCAPGGFGGPEGFGRGGFGRGPFGGGRFGGRGGRRRLFDAAELKLILLKLISDEPRHGYDLIRGIEELSGGAYVPSPGVVYPTLTLLADMDLAVEQPGDGSRKLFAITDAGKAHLLENREAALEAMARLEALAKMSERTDGAPIRRAMGNLVTAMRNRLEREGADSDTMLEVAALIDEAAGRIERLK